MIKDRRTWGLANPGEKRFPDEEEKREKKHNRKKPLAKGKEKTTKTGSSCGESASNQIKSQEKDAEGQKGEVSSEKGGFECSTEPSSSQ